MIGLFGLGADQYGSRSMFLFYFVFKALLPHYGQESEQGPDTVKDSPSVAYFIQLVPPQEGSRTPPNNKIGCGLKVQYMSVYGAVQIKIKTRMLTSQPIAWLMSPDPWL